MVDTLSRVTTLLFAVAILLVGHGLQLTLLPVYALSVGWSSTQIGFTGSFYFLGFVTGCVFIPGIVSGVGHIRSFMVMAAAATVALLTAALLVHVWAWMLLRFATGMALAGLYMIVESWLTEVCPKDRRSAVLSVYLAISLLGMGVGQFPLMLVSPDLRLFVLAAALLSLAIIPIGLTRIESPRPIPHVRVTPRTLIRASRVAVVCAAVAGMVTGAFWTLGPVTAQAFGLDPGNTGLMMSLGVLGGALSQYPIGHISDRMDRRVVIGTLAVTGAGVCVLGALFAASNVFVLYGAVLLLCATAMPIYALCIALAAENTELTLVEVAGGMLLAHGLGSILGPMIVAPQMTWIGASMFFVFFAGCMATAAIWTFSRYFAIERPTVHDVLKPMLPRTTQAVAELLGEKASSRARDEA